MIKKNILAFLRKNAPQTRLFYETTCAAGKTDQTKCAADHIFD